MVINHCHICLEEKCYYVTWFGENGNVSVGCVLHLYHAKITEYGVYTCELGVIVKNNDIWLSGPLLFSKHCQVPFQLKYHFSCLKVLVISYENASMDTWYRATLWFILFV